MSFASNVLANEHAINNQEYEIDNETNVVDYEKVNVLDMSSSEKTLLKEEMVLQLKEINPNILDAEVTLIND